MLRVHRASGHAGMSNLVQLLRARGSPGWAIELASNLECPECREASQVRPRPPASTGEMPPIFSHLEHEEPSGMKRKMIIWRDRGSGLTLIDHLQKYEGNWEPKTEDVVRSFCKWVMTYPAPTWVLADSARYYTSSAFTEHLGRSGVGLSIAPAEAHWIMGPEERAIGIAKRIVERLAKEGSNVSIPDLYTMAAGAMNTHVGARGYSAFQRAFGHGGGVLDDEQLLQDVDPGKAFGRLVKERQRAKLAFEKERAADRFGKFANTAGRKVTQYKSGQLVMLRRQKVKPGKVKGHWSGPVRVILLEGSTAWLSSGSTLVRAKLNRREELWAVMEGAAVYRQPVSVDTLLRSFQGRYFPDVSGDVPSEKQMHDLTPTTVLQEPSAERLKNDAWTLRHVGGERVLIRQHHLPRLGLFNPGRASNIPVTLDELAGNRTTYVKPLHRGNAGEPTVIKDTIDIIKNLPDRWVGETHFELLPEPQPAKKVKKVDRRGAKRKAEKEIGGH